MLDGMWLAFWVLSGLSLPAPPIDAGGSEECFWESVLRKPIEERRAEPRPKQDWEK